MNYESWKGPQKFLTVIIPLYKFKISGSSMMPTFKDGDTVLVNRLAYLFGFPKIRDIVALKDPRDGKVLIKRVTKIVDSRYFVLGDNLEHSTDSRKFGMIGKSEIVGKVIHKISNT